MNIKQVVLLIASIPLFCHAQTENTFNWNEAKLTWNDYYAKPDTTQSSSIAVAVSYTDFNYKVDMEGNGKLLDVQVDCFFCRSKSWALERGKSDEILQREQLHFDLTEKYARLFRKELQDHKWEEKTFQKDFQAIYKKLRLDHTTEQKTYDRETKRGKDAAKETEWKNKVAKDLRNLDKYDSPTFTVKLK